MNSSQFDVLTPPVDLEVLDSLRELGDENEDFLGEVIDTFFRNVHPQIHGLHKALQSGDFANLGRIAHKLKGSCGTLGANHLMKLCAEMETRAQIDDQNTLTALCARIVTEFGRVSHALEKARSDQGVQ